MVVFLPRHVYAYLDPGTGSMIFQAAMAALAATAYAVRVYWGKLRRLFSRRGDDASQAADHPATEE
jgi:hypothetical protein